MGFGCGKGLEKFRGCLLRKIDGGSWWCRGILVVAFTSFRFFFFARALFSSSLSSKAFFWAGAESGVGTAKSGVTTSGFSCCNVILGALGVGSRMLLVCAASVGNFDPI